MNRNVLWKIVLILGVLVVFTVAIIPTKGNPEPIRRGLDLKGGIHLVMRVNVNEALRLEVDQAMNSMRTQAGTQKLPVPQMRRLDDTSFMATLPAGIGSSEYERMAGDFLPSFDSTRLPNGLRLRLEPAAQAQLERDTVEQTKQAIDRRVNALGVTEPVINPEGKDRIVIQLPGVDDPERVKDIIGATALLQFRIVEGGAFATKQAAFDATAPAMREQVDILAKNKEDDFGRTTGVEYVAVNKNVPVSGHDLKTARVSKGELGAPVIEFTLTPEGGPKFGTLTTANVKRQLAIVLDNKVISAPVIDEPIPSGQGIIRGNFTQQSASDLALLLRSGSLPASMTPLEERTVGPSLGRDSIRQGVQASLIGFALVVVSIILYYRGAGINAIVALLLNLVILLGMMAYFKATLTLPGIAGIILTLGMAVDSNVLVFERIREELRAGKTVKAAIESGFTLAFGTVIDTHLTTIIAALFLFQFGTGPIRGFAVTLLIGLAASVFTAFFVSKIIFQIVYANADRHATSMSI